MRVEFYKNVCKNGIAMNKIEKKEGNKMEIFATGRKAIKLDTQFGRLHYYSCSNCKKLLDVKIGKITRREHLEVLNKLGSHQCKIEKGKCRLCKSNKLKKIKKGYYCVECGIATEL